MAERLTAVLARGSARRRDHRPSQASLGRAGAVLQISPEHALTCGYVPRFRTSPAIRRAPTRSYLKPSFGVFAVTQQVLSCGVVAPDEK